MNERSTMPSPTDWLVGGGEMGQRIRATDWSATPLGPVHGWPQSLRSAVSILLPSRAQICLFWGPELVAIYNDAYRPTLGVKHPWALGRPAREVWSEFWQDVLRPLLEGVLHTGEAFWASDFPFFLERLGYPEETYFDISYDPVRDESGRVGGVFCIVGETTARVVGERRLRLLRDLGRLASVARSVDEVFEQAGQVLAGFRHDIAFARLFGAGETTPWPLDGGEHLLEGEALHPFGRLGGGPWPEAVRAVAVLPIAVPGQPPYGHLVAGASPRLPLDAAYLDFLRLVAAGIAAAGVAARALEEQRARAEALAELDRAKTAFFSNISHEFRTPLTLMLGPLEELLGDAALSPALRERLAIVERNGLRLLRLVNTLLDFARLEAGRASARFEPVDLASLTAELASNFRSACERARLHLVVDCPPLPVPVWVDPPMWERIVLNLLSNAFKFTLRGGIDVRLRMLDGRVELAIADTGAGIAADALPHVFERFRRIEGTEARSHEGSGIGLALVQELAALHGGSVAASSKPGVGSTFTVTLPLGHDHLPADALRAAGPRPRGDHARTYVEEALGWLHAPPLEPIDADAAASGPRLLVADDNADMREHLAHVLGRHWRVTAVGDGRAALDALAAAPFDLVLTDVMMPRMDGFALLRAIRADPATAQVPVMMLSARAGEEARVEGLAAGADDYVVKPFTAAQLVAQVHAQLTVQRARRESAAERERLLAQEQAARREAQLQRERFVSLFGQAPNPIVILRGPAHVIDLANAATLRVWNRRADDVLGRPLFDALPELRGQGFEALLDRVLSTGVPYEGKEMATRLARRVGGDLVTTYFNLLCTPLRDVDDAVEGVMVTAFEVTEEVVAREQMARLRQEAEQANRAKDEFLAMLGHELRNPLAPVVTALHLLRLRGHREQELDILERQAAHLARLVDDLLDVSRITRGKVELRRQRIDLAQVVDKAVEIVRPLLEQRGHPLQRVGLDRADLALDADPQRLAQVVSNLLTNAAKYSEPGAPITLRAERSGERVWLAVRDEGAGIDPAMLERVFDLFVQQPQTLERAEGGLGLGLAIARSLAQLHGGTIRVSSDGPGHGSEFVLDLPAAPPEVAQAVPTAPPPAAQVGSRRQRILVVDDNVDAAATLGQVLELMGHDVRVAHRATASLELAAGFAPEVAFIDIGLPDIDGFTLGRRLRAGVGANALLVAVTGYGLAVDRERSAAAGFDAHLVKPIELEALAALLDTSPSSAP